MHIISQGILNLLLRLAACYPVVPLGWAMLRILFHDRWWWLFLLNSMAFYLFLPLPVLILLVLLIHRWSFLPGLAAALLLGYGWYGQYLVPRFPPAETHPHAPTLTLMTYNTMMSNPHPEHIIAAIQAAHPDVVTMQELNLQTAEALWRTLSERYPYQAIEIHGGTGMGVLSRYPLRPVAARLPGAWMGRPQVFSLEVEETEVLLINTHAISIGGTSGQAFSPSAMEQALRERERQARTIGTFAQTVELPLIVAGDWNTSDQSDTYAILTTHLTDSWQAAGWGPGHTYPGTLSLSDSPGGIWPLPFFLRWLVRIDYIFHSHHWQTQAVRTGPWNGTTDHRPVVAHLRLVVPVSFSAPVSY